MPDITFRPSDRFGWDPVGREITYVAGGDPASLLHEVGHARLDHTSYTRDIELLRKERHAWTYARDHLAALYGVSIDDDVIEASLDTYRDWLHARSLCPDCRVSGVQHTAERYRCIHCEREWTVNDARTCQLRRTITKTPR